MNDDCNASLIKDYIEYECGLECKVLKSGSFKVNLDGVYYPTSNDGYEKIDLIERDVIRMIDELRKRYNTDFDYQLGYNTFILTPIYF